MGGARNRPRAPPPTPFDNHLALESPAGADLEGESPDPLTALATRITNELATLMDVPASAEATDGDVPTAPTTALLDSPRDRPIRVHLNGETWEGVDDAEGDLEDDLRSGRIPGHLRDPRRALRIMASFCDRPIDPAGGRVVRDELEVTWSPPFPGLGTTSRFQFQRTVEVTHPDADHQLDTHVSFDLIFQAHPACRAARDWTVFRAPAASSPCRRLATATDSGAQFVDVLTPHELEQVIDGAGFGTLLDRRADDMRGPCPN